MIKLVFIFFVLISFVSVFSQTDSCACCNPENDQFDFWVGKWEVYDTLDNYVGKNEIIKQYENCLIQENWISKGINRGTSYNYYNPADSSWNQLWIDNQGTILELKGSFNMNKMVLKSGLQRGKKIDWYYHQISWEPLTSRNVKQTWDLFDKNGNKLRNLFTGIYKPFGK